MPTNMAQDRRLTRSVRCFLALGLLLGFGTTAASAQTPAAIASLPAHLSEYMRPLTQMRDFSGRILVAVNGTVILDSAYTAPGDAPSTPATRFGIGSLTKSFTAAAIQVLQARGKLKLTDSVARYLPELKAWPPITIEQLLTHSAGVPDYYVQADYPKRRESAITLVEFARWVGAKPLDFAPGARSSYSNSGYAMLALLIERASGLSYPEFIAQALLGPAGMTATGDLRSVRGSLAPGHNPAPPPAYLQSTVPFDLSWMVGSGSIYSTTGDLLRWIRAVRSDRLFPFSKQAYPYGWSARQIGHEAALQPTGRIPAGYASQMTQFLARDVTVIILSDIQSDVVTGIGDAITAMLLGQPYEVPRVRQAVVLTDSAATQAVGRYEFGPGFGVTVRRGPGGLELAGPEGDFLPLDAVADGPFFFRVLQVKIRFGRDSTSRDFLLWNGSAKAYRAAP